MRRALPARAQAPQFLSACARTSMSSIAAATQLPAGIPEWVAKYVERAAARGCHVADVRLLSSDACDGGIYQRLLRKITGERIRYWTYGTNASHEYAHVKLIPRPADRTTSVVGKFLADSSNRFACVHEGALASLMDSALGTCAFTNECGGPTLYLEFFFRRPLPLDAHAAFALFTTRILRVEERKTLLSGEITDGRGNVLVDCNGLWRNYGVRFSNADSERAELALRKAAEHFGKPNYPINDKIAARGHHEHLWDDVDWVTELASQHGVAEDTARVHHHMDCTATPPLADYIRNSGKVRTRYFFDSLRRVFVASIQFSGWCQGPIGMVQGGAIFSGHVDACDAALLARSADFGVRVDPAHTRLLYVKVDYRSFTPLDRTYLYEVRLTQDPSRPNIVKAASRCVTPATESVDAKLHSEAQLEFSMAGTVPIADTGCKSCL